MHTKQREPMDFAVEWIEKTGNNIHRDKCHEPAAALTAGWFSVMICIQRINCY